MHAFVNEVVVDSNPAVSVGVQTWSRGELFPAVISRVEVYDTPATYLEWLALSTQIAHHAKRDYLYRNYLANFYARTLDERLIRTEWVLSYPGLRDVTYSSYDTAARVARLMAGLVEGIADRNAAARALEAGRNPRDLAAAWIDGMRVAA